MPAAAHAAAIEVRGDAESASFVLRFQTLDQNDHSVVLHARRGCRCGCGGSWDELGASTHLHNTLALIQVNRWHPPARKPARRRRAQRVPTFERFALDWLAGKIDGTFGPTTGIAPSTAALYQSQLKVHLLPFFGALRIDEITRAICLEFKALKVDRARELRDGLEAGADLRDRYGRRARPLSPTSIRKLIDLLGMILEEAIHDGFLTSNPARGRRMRVAVKPPIRPALELDELASLLDAAAALDRETRRTVDRSDLGLTTRLVEHLLRRGRRPAQIAAELKVARSTVSWHLQRLGVVPGQGYVARRIVCELLGRAGLRAAEVCELKIADIRLQSSGDPLLRVRDAKTPAGVRDVLMSPDLVDAVVEHLHLLREARLPTAPEAYLVPSTTGSRMSTRRVRAIVADAVLRANIDREAVGVATLPTITPHALRRTYVSIALLANGFDVKWVMGQVGHADSKMTMDVYAQLMRRVRREHGLNFDRLVREGRLGGGRVRGVETAKATLPVERVRRVPAPHGSCRWPSASSCWRCSTACMRSALRLSTA